MSLYFDNCPKFPVTCAATDVFTMVSSVSYVQLKVDDAVQFYGTTLPTNITADTVYYVVSGNLTATTFKVSLTKGGTPVDLYSPFGTNVTFATAAYDSQSGIASTRSGDAFAERLPKDMLYNGRGEAFVSTLKENPPADKLKKSYDYFGTIGTLSAGGESWG